MNKYLLTLLALLPATLRSQGNGVLKRIDTLCSPVVQYNTNYIFENEKDHMTHVIYFAPNKRNIELQQALTPLILNKKIPETVFNKRFFNTLNFAGQL